MSIHFRTELIKIPFPKTQNQTNLDKNNNKNKKEDETLFHNVLHISTFSFACSFCYCCCVATFNPSPLLHRRPLSSYLYAPPSISNLTLLFTKHTTKTHTHTYTRASKQTNFYNIYFTVEKNNSKNEKGLTRNIIITSEKRIDKYYETRK